MPLYSSDSTESLRSLLGGGKVADVLLWRDRVVSASILAGFTVTWFLMEVAEVHFITIACYILMSLMLGIFAWTRLANVVERNPPSPSYVQNLLGYTLEYTADKVISFLMRLYEISLRREDLAHFFMVIFVLWILSVVGNYASALNLLYLSYLLLATVPALYARYESEVEYLATQGNRDMRRIYSKLDSKFLSKIPRGAPVSKTNKKFK